MLSRKIVQGELAAAGLSSRLVITDDLEVPLVRRYPGAALRAVLAGDDILMYAQRESGSERAYRSILASASGGTNVRAAVLAAAAKVEQLKRALAGA